MSQSDLLQLADKHLIAAQGYRQLADEAKATAQALLDQYAASVTESLGVQVGQVWTYGAGKWAVTGCKGVRSNGEVDVCILLHLVKPNGYADRTVRLDVLLDPFQRQFTMTQERVKRRGRSHDRALHP